MLKQVITRNKKLFGLIVIFVVIALIPAFVESPYYLDLFIAMMVNSVLGMMFIMGLRAGLINMGIIPFFGIGAYASATLATKVGLDVWLCIPLAALITMAFALIIGIVLIGSGSGGLTFVILSSVIGMLFNVVVGNIRYLGAWDGIPNIPPPTPINLGFMTIEFTSKIPFFYLGMAYLLIIILIIYAFYAACTGRAWSAIGMSPRLAECLGVNLFRYKLLAFVMTCTICGLIGTFYAHYQSFIIPDSFSMWQNIYVQIYASGRPGIRHFRAFVRLCGNDVFPRDDTLGQRSGTYLHRPYPDTADTVPA